MLIGKKPLYEKCLKKTGCVLVKANRVILSYSKMSVPGWKIDKFMTMAEWTEKFLESLLERNNVWSKLAQIGCMYDFLQVNFNIKSALRQNYNLFFSLLKSQSFFR